jgi:phage terminase Nu1 subunit (DNA packaging protein)
VTKANIDALTVSLSELAKVCRMANRTAAEYTKAGIFIQRPKGRYPLIKCVNRYIEKIRESASGRDAAKDPSRAALSRAQASVATAKAGVLSGKLVDVKEMEAEAIAEWRKLRGLLLALPARVANRAVGMSREDLSLIDHEAREILEEMAHATHTSPVPLEGEMEADAQPAEKAKAKRLDRRNHKAPVRRKRAAGSR